MQLTDSPSMRRGLLRSGDREALSASEASSQDTAPLRVPSNAAQHMPASRHRGRNNATWRSMLPCCEREARWRGCCCECGSGRFVARKLLFEDRKLESIFLSSSKRSRLAKISLPLILILGSLICVTVAALAAVAEEQGIGSNASVIATPTAAGTLLFAIAGVTMISVSTRKPEARYQLTVATAWLALVTITLAYFALATDLAIFLGDTSMAPFLSLLGLLWVCQKLVVIADVIAARLFLAIVPINALLLLIGGGVMLFFQLFICISFDLHIYANGIVRMGLEILTSVVAASGTLLWFMLRKESAAREMFYWNRVFVGNIEELDAEANPFDAARLRAWLTQSSTNHVRGVQPGSSQTSDVQSMYWAIDSDALVVQERIAAGGGGVVYKALLYGKPVAAKQVFAVCLPSSTQFDELAAEVAVLAQLSHQHIVRFLGLSQQEEGRGTSTSTQCTPLLIVQELCQTNLRAFMTDHLSTLSMEEWWQLTQKLSREIASGMSYLHSRKIEHRDLKPENVFLTDSLTVRIGDFGVSHQFLSAQRASARVSESFTAESTGAGTPAYMPPEALRLLPISQANSTRVGFKTDVYSFGVVLWEMLCSFNAVNLSSACDALHELSRSNFCLDGQAKTNLSDAEQYTHIKLRWKTPPHELVAPCCSEVVLGICTSCCNLDFAYRPTFHSICQTLDPSYQPPIDSPEQKARSKSNIRRQILARLRTGTSSSSVQQSSSDLSAAQRFSDSLSTLGTASTNAADYSSLQQYSDKQLETTGPQIDSVQLSRIPTRLRLQICLCRFWQSRGLQFSDPDEESRFLSYMHSKEFFAHLRWPFIVLAMLYFVFAATMLMLGGTIDTISPLMQSVLFAVAACFSWLPKRRRHSYTAMFTAALVATVVRTGMAWWENFVHLGDTPLPTDDPPGLYCTCDIVNDTCPWECVFYADFRFALFFGLSIFQGLTAPVTLMVLGLPCYQYLMLVALCFVSWVVSTGTLAPFVFGNLDFTDGASYLALVVAGLTIYPSCCASALSHERSRRSLFRSYCKLCKQEDELLGRATFRRYREAFVSNWRLFTSEVKPDPRTQHRLSTQPSAVTTGAVV